MNQKGENQELSERSLTPWNEPAPALSEETEQIVPALSLEEDIDWIVATYRKQALKITSSDLDEALGGRGPKHYLSLSLQDKNPVQFRQSLQEQVFPTPREVKEDLLEIPSGKVMLQADAGMGKTVFIKMYMENLLQGDLSLQWFPLPVHFSLEDLPEDSGFDLFIERALQKVLEIIFLEKEDDPELSLDKSSLLRSLRLLFERNKYLFFMDGLDRMKPEDRFRTYNAVVLENSVMRGNFKFIATRPFHFGAFADEALLRRGQEACFQISFDSIKEKQRKTYLGETMTKGLAKVGVANPELLTTPILLRIVQLISDPMSERDIDYKTELYSKFFQSILKGEKTLPYNAPERQDEKDKETKSTKESDPVKINEKTNSQSGVKTQSLAKTQEVEVENILDGLARVAFSLASDGLFPRFENIDNGIEWHRLGDPRDPANPFYTNNSLIPELENIIQRSQTGWEFRHPSFQEYLAARYLSVSQDWKKIIKNRCRDERWFEIFKYFGGLSPEHNNNLYDIFFAEGALFAAGNTLLETRCLEKYKALFTRQLLKYQCRELYPQFSKFRQTQIQAVIESVGPDQIKRFALVLLSREKRDSRILFGLFELLLAVYKIDFLVSIDRQEFDTLDRVPELKEFLSEAKKNSLVDSEVVRRWTESVTVSSGKFIYQDEKDSEDWINLREFSIMKYPVTNALFQQYDPNYRSLYPNYSIEDDQPVVGINYYETNIIAIWLGFRLPTEKEWEKSARGVDGRDYPWGEAAGYQSGYNNTSDFVIGKTTPVEEYEKGISPYGCFDMSGNIWEWCVQLHASKYSTHRIVRGGSWLNYLVHAKCITRNSFDPGDRYPSVGARFVSQPHTETEEKDEENAEE